MAKVIIGPINSKWETTPEEDGLIFNAMTAPVKGRWFVPSFRSKKWDGCVHLYSPSSKRLASGLVPDAVDVLERAGHKVAMFEAGGKEIPLRKNFNLNFELKEEHQIRALEAMADNWRGIIHAATNAGKTKIAEAWCALHDARVLYLVPSRELLEQTVNSFKKDTDLDVGSISATTGFFPGKDVTVCLVSSIAKRKNSYSGESINQKSVGRFAVLAQTFDAVIIDECHHVKARTWQGVARLLTKCVRWYGLSGTPWDDGDPAEVLQIKALLGPVISRIENSELIGMGWSAKPKIKIIKIDGNIFEEDYGKVYDAGITFNTKRNGTIAKLCDDIAKDGKQALVFTQRLPQGRILHEKLAEMGIDHRVISGQTNKYLRGEFFKDFKNKKFPVLISNVMGEGVDIPSLNVLIFASGGKSSKKVLQQIGRGIRRKPSGENEVDVYDFNDETHDYLKRHSSARFHLYRDEGFELEEVAVEGVIIGGKIKGAEKKRVKKINSSIPEELIEFDELFAKLHQEYHDSRRYFFKSGWCSTKSRYVETALSNAGACGLSLEEFLRGAFELSRSEYSILLPPRLGSRLGIEKIFAWLQAHGNKKSAESLDLETLLTKEHEKFLRIREMGWSDDLIFMRKVEEFAPIYLYGHAGFRRIYSETSWMQARIGKKIREAGAMMRKPEFAKTYQEIMGRVCKISSISNFNQK